MYIEPIFLPKILPKQLITLRTRPSILHLLLKARHDSNCSPYQIVPNTKSYAKSLYPEKDNDRTHLTARKRDVIIHGKIVDF